jgi:penicillin amidase
MLVARFRLALIPLIILFAIVSCAAPPEDGAEQLTRMARESLSQLEGELELPGLRDEVEILRDRWGVPHIYARNVDDLFFAQGFAVAQDRLWEMEMWRRYAEGRAAELEGPERFATDRLYRLLKFRDLENDDEWTSYHPDGRAIMAAFAGGVTAFMEHRADNLPVEFKLTGVRPEPWTAETPTLRLIQRSIGSARAELRLARQVHELGADEANRRANPDPWYELEVPDGLDVSIISEDVLAALNGNFQQMLKPDILPEYAEAMRQIEVAEASMTPANRMARGFQWFFEPSLPQDLREEIGSNNWVVSGAMTGTGSPILANDPHRQVTNPSLRYMVHLNAPGWNVIGSGEPSLPGVAIGHNERVAWGLTIVGTDHNDVYVEELNPENTNEVRWGDTWEPLRVITEEIGIKGEAPRTVELKFSRHGPILYEDLENHRAYALRTTTLEPGTAHYLGSLRTDQVNDCREFLDAMDYWKQPSENMICADVDGNIAWQASALTPRREGWLGRLPVPGTGSHEWDGFRDDLPEEFNPERGWIATANHNIHPPGYHPPLMFKSGPPYRRFERIKEVLEGGGPFSIDDFKRLQVDAYSSAAAEAQALFQGWTGDSEEIEQARTLLAEWDSVFNRDSAAAALYFTWRQQVDERALDDTEEMESRVSLTRTALGKAIAELQLAQGSDLTEWRWGRINQLAFDHPLVPLFNLPVMEKGGGAGTVGSNGATYRELLDLADWDRSVGTNTPGQSGQPESPHYSDLLSNWVNAEYFPMPFSREAVEEHTTNRLVLTPQASQGN